MTSRRSALEERRAEERARKASILDLIARKRNQQAELKSVVLGMEDSDKDVAFKNSKLRPALLDDTEEEDREDEEKDEAAQMIGSSGNDTVPAKTLKRLIKKADPVSQQEQALSSAEELTAHISNLSLSSKSCPPNPQRQLSTSPATDEDGHRNGESSDEESSKALVLGSSRQFRLSPSLSKKLYPHQVEGVSWLWRLHESASGGILADDMGLGKTMQCSAFLAGLLQNKLIRRAMVIAPKTLLAHWVRELAVCGVGKQTHEFFGSESERSRCLGRVFLHRGVLLTTYGMVLHNSDSLAECQNHDPDEGPLWDVMILDEGHKIKNPRMQLRKHLDAIPARIRVIISGTPIQNNLQEMHTLFDFACPGLLGDARTFKDQYEKRITNGNDKHATVGERERGAAAAAHLRTTIAPFFLRREKKDVFSINDSSVPSDTNTSRGNNKMDGSQEAKPQSMGRKNDFIVWLRLNPMQRKVYEAFLNSDQVKAVFNQTNSALAALTLLKKICDHPALLSKRAEEGIVSGANRARRKLAGRESESEIESGSSEDEYYSSDEERGQQRRRRGDRHGRGQHWQQQQRRSEGGDDQWWDWAKQGAVDQLLQEVHTTGFEASCKTVFVMQLLHSLVKEGHRTLIFSQSRVMLNILEAAIKAEGWRFCRIDGTVASAQDREARVRQFQSDPCIPVFLLTSQVGGLGLTLTAANRVIIVDPAWNPSTDNQAVDRAYRIGQTRDVVVYRLISCGTVEEKIYRKQVYKGGLSRTGTEEGEQFRYFSQQELRDLFRLDASEAQRSTTQQALHRMHAHQRKSTPQLDQHLGFLEGLEGFAGVSDHDLLYSKKEVEGAPTAQPFGSQPPPQPGHGTTFGARSSGAVHRAQGSKPGSAIKKAASREWSGAGDISDMFSRALTLGGGRSDGAATAVPPGRGAPPPALGLPATVRAHRPATPAEESRRRVEELEDLLRKKKQLLASSMVARLPDSGSKIKAQVDQLERELAAELGALPAAAPGITPPSSAPSEVPPKGADAAQQEGHAAPVPTGSALAGADGWQGGRHSSSGRSLPPPFPTGHQGATNGGASSCPVPSAVAPPTLPTPLLTAPSFLLPARAQTQQAGPAPSGSPLRNLGARLYDMATSMLGARPAGDDEQDTGGVVDLSVEEDAGQVGGCQASKDMSHGVQEPGGHRGKDRETTPSAVHAPDVAGAGVQQVNTQEAAAVADSENEEAWASLEEQQKATKHLKKRLAKYYALATELACKPGSELEVTKVMHKLERIRAEYKAAKMKLQFMEATCTALPE